jgi:hypothetical protein
MKSIFRRQQQVIVDVLNCPKIRGCTFLGATTLTAVFFNSVVVVLKYWYIQPSGQV